MRDSYSMRIQLLSLLVFAGTVGAAPNQSPHLGGISLGVGDWINVSDGDWHTREDYGTLSAFGLYFSGYGWNGSLGLPVKSAFKRIGHKSRVSLGDGDFSLGKRFGMVSPRIVLRMPLYPWSVDDASENELFIGSGNVNLGLGLGVKVPTAWLPSKWEVKADLEGNTAITQALADYGSSHVTGVLQGTYAIGNRLKLGANTLCLFNYWRWIPTFWDQQGETNFTIQPGLLAGIRLYKATYLDAKAGMTVYEIRSLVAPKFPLQPQMAYNFGLSVFQGF
jgi:hypothetical protein